MQVFYKIVEHFSKDKDILKGITGTICCERESYSLDEQELKKNLVNED